MLVSGKLGFMDGFLLMVPIGNSESKAFSQEEGAPSLKQPELDELEARECLPALMSLPAPGVETIEVKPAIGVCMAIELTEQDLACASLSKSSCANSSMSNL